MVPVGCPHYDEPGGSSLSCDTQPTDVAKIRHMDSDGDEEANMEAGIRHTDSAAFARFNLNTELEEIPAQCTKTLPMKVSGSVSTRAPASSRGSIDSTEAAGRVSVILQDAKRQGRMRLLRLRGPTLALGPALVLSGAIVDRFAEDFSAMRVCCRISQMLGLHLCVLSLLPSDRRCVPLCTFLAISWAFWFGSNWGRKAAVNLKEYKCNNTFLDTPCWFWMVRDVGRLVISIASFSLGIWLALGLCGRLNSANLLKRMWKSCSLMSICLSSAQFLKAVAGIVLRRGDIISSYLVLAIAYGVIGMACYHQPFICFVQSWLMSRGEAAAAAASISQLLVRQSAKDILAKARGSFTYVSADKLLQRDMADSDPNPALSTLISKGRLGEVDAFVSHSWTDDADLKWKALQDWREKFKQEHQGREPKLWIDKYSIDQNNVDDSLACLPVYLAGCRKLLILCGGTYLNRLWCLVEIFIFLQMGGELDNLEVRLLDEHLKTSMLNSFKRQLSHKAEMAPLSPSNVNAISDKSTWGFSDQIEHFDPRTATCTKDADTVRLHDVVGAAGYAQIEELVKNAFGKCLRDEIETN